MRHNTFPCAYISFFFTQHWRFVRCCIEYFFFFPLFSSSHFAQFFFFNTLSIVFIVTTRRRVNQFKRKMLFINKKEKKKKENEIKREKYNVQNRIEQKKRLMCSNMSKIETKNAMGKRYTRSNMNAKPICECKFFFIFSSFVLMSLLFTLDMLRRLNKFYWNPFLSYSFFCYKYYVTINLILPFLFGRCHCRWFYSV